MEALFLDSGILTHGEKTIKVSEMSNTMHYDPKLEKRILRYWEKQHLPEKSLKKGGKKRFSFYDGPPTANNEMGVHHAWGRTYKDLYLRLKTMQGYDVRKQPGFDCQGLWVEVEVEKALGFNSKKDIEKYGIANFSKKCRQRVLHFVKIWIDLSKKLGMWMDWDNAYYTMSDQNIEHVWFFLKNCWKKGWLYEGLKTAPWCPRCGTSLSQHELVSGYKDVEHDSIYMKLKLKGKEEYLLVWTTTPWTLPANVAVAVNPDLDYVKVDVDGETLILCKERLDAVIKDYVLLDEFKGKELKGLEYETIIPLPLQPKNHPIILSKEFVSEEEGTGLVHIAPGHGQEDYELGLQYNLPQLCPVDESGNFDDSVGWLKGKNVFGANKEIIKWLKNNGKLFKTEKIRHRYPHCWRCDTELIYRLVKGWYINCQHIKPQLIKNAKRVFFSPPYTKERMLDWLRNLRDWSISRKRYWGLPLPIWECECGRREVIGSLKELRKKAVKGVKQLKELHRPWIDRVELKCRCGKTMKRIKDVGDCWLDAGIVPFSTLNYLYGKSYWKKWFPADFVTEMHEQVRLWFYSMLFMSTTITGKAPYRSILAHGMVLDEKGREMHKSWGNAISAEEGLGRMGADVMRWMFIWQNPAQSLCFGFTPAKDVRNKLNIIYNFINFVETYCEANGFTPKERSNLTVADKWLLSRLQSVKAEVTKNLDELKPHLAAKLLEDFVLNDLSRWYGHLVRERVKVGYEGEDKYAALWTLYKASLESLLLLAPMLPFITEDLYLRYFKKFEKSESIHLMRWPKVEKKYLDKNLERKMQIVREIVEAANAIRAERGLRLRWPVKRLVVSGWDPKEFEDVIKKMANVKEVVTGKMKAKVEVKLNYSVVGKKYGKKVKELEKDLAKMKFTKHPKKVKIGKIVLNEKELVVRERTKEGKSFSKGVVSLDTREDEIIRKERLLRELIRRIQQERKRMGLKVDEKIVLTLSKKIGFEKEIKKSVGAKSIEYGKGNVKFKFEEDFLEFGVKVLK